jgi:hypothetical protein
VSLVAHCMTISKIMKFKETTAYLSLFVPQFLRCDGCSRKIDATASLWQRVGRAAMCDVIKTIKTLAPHG